ITTPTATRSTSPADGHGAIETRTILRTGRRLRRAVFDRRTGGARRTRPQTGPSDPRPRLMGRSRTGQLLERVGLGFESPSDTDVYPTRQHLDVDPPVRAVGEGDAELRYSSALSSGSASASVLTKSRRPATSALGVSPIARLSSRRPARRLAVEAVGGLGRQSAGGDGGAMAPSLVGTGV